MAILAGIDRAVWRAFAFNAFKQGYSFNYSLRLFRDMGFSVQRAWGLSQFRQVNNLVLGWKAAAGVDRTKVFPVNKLIEVDSLKGWKYQADGFATFMDRDTGQTFSQQVSFRSNRHLSLDGYARVAEREWDKKERYPSRDLVSLNFQVVGHEKGLSY